MAESATGDVHLLDKFSLVGWTAEQPDSQILHYNMIHTIIYNTVL